MSAFARRPIAACLVLAATMAGCGGDDEAGVRPDGASAAGLPPVTRGAWVPLTPRPGPEVGLALFDSVAGRARGLAAGPWIPPDTALSAPAAALTYAQYRGIRFRREATLWPDGAPVRLQLFHPGAGFRVPVAVTLVESGAVRSLTFDAARFDYGDEVEGMELGLPGRAGHAGFRLLYPLNTSERWDEVVSFLGASYFRLLGPGHVYGLSARGLAVGVASPQGEEFPDFTRFWLVRPEPGAASVTVVALLEGPSVTGAYRFVLTPGAPPAAGAAPGPPAPSPAPGPRPTRMDVEVRLFARADVPRLGMAPLTSMYLHGTFERGGDDDVRPRVHDSEGLLMHTADGEWIWRPLSNRTGVSVTSLRDVEPRGFGLVQRDRDFDSYLDLEARYDRRPSLWVEATGGEWGGGGVELVELPSPSEFNDNIVAYWAPDGGMRAGESRTFSYRLTTFDAHLPGQSLAPVVRTRVGWDALPGQAEPPPRTRRRVVVDFGAVAGPGGPSDASPAPGRPALPDARVELSRGTAEDVRVLPLPDGGVRATFALVPDGNAPADMRLQLVRGERVVSETWSWLWRADDDG
jgi:glucans biosynthesis protein